GALEDDEPARHPGDLGHELERARARADHGDSLAREVVLVLPLGGMEGRPGERLASGDVGQARAVELNDRADDRVWGERLLAIVDPDAQHPARSGAIPARRQHLGAEADALAHAVPVRAPFEVLA